TRLDSIGVIKVLGNSISSPTPSTILRSIFPSYFQSAAKYLNIIGLLDLTRRTVAYMIIDKTLEDMCTNIKND
ncbi:unnamed protein product, partial [Brassica oleracea]